MLEASSGGSIMPMPEERLARIEAKIDHLTSRGVTVDTNIHKATVRVDRLDSKIEKLAERVDGLATGVDGLGAKVEALKTKIDSLQDDMNRIAEGVEGRAKGRPKAWSAS